MCHIIDRVCNLLCCPTTGKELYTGGNELDGGSPAPTGSEPQTKQASRANSFEIENLLKVSNIFFVNFH